MNDAPPDAPPLALRLEVSKVEAGQRVDVVLVARVPSMSRAKAKALAAEGALRVNGRRVAKGVRLEAGDVVTLAELPPPARFRAAPDPDLPLEVVHEDPRFIVVHKDAGVPTHPLRPEERGTLAGALVARYPEMASVGHRPREPGLLHRLDTGTSGLVLAARDEGAFVTLRDALLGGSIDKRYLALALGSVRAPQRVDLPVAHDPGDRRRMVAGEREGARAASTEVLQSEVRALPGLPAPGDVSRVELRAAAARRHQVRVHLATLGHPLLGDTLYGGPALPELAGHCLHASRLVFAHPETGAPVDVRSTPRGWP
ncbi:MAG: RluA family pseudouridine synthase [Myxococcota bacterium]